MRDLKTNPQAEYRKIYKLSQRIGLVRLAKMVSYLITIIIRIENITDTMDGFYTFSVSVRLELSSQVTYMDIYSVGGTNNISIPNILQNLSSTQNLPHVFNKIIE